MLIILMQFVNEDKVFHTLFDLQVKKLGNVCVAQRLWHSCSLLFDWLVNCKRHIEHKVCILILSATLI
jgi:hypothetical protein